MSAVSSRGPPRQKGGAQGRDPELQYLMTHLTARQTDAHLPRRRALRLRLHPRLLLGRRIGSGEDCAELDVHDRRVGVQVGEVLQNDALGMSDGHMDVRIGVQ